MGSQKQWDALRKYNPYKGKIPPPPRMDEEELEEADNEA